ncbi:hypothetical protein [Saccharothrix deserti]|uniref:hypothetical protein n=1 Tax=Saccharothrix deserti TaxID=2593674 RepID=UPI00131AE7FE|nr:hypothetical protein [Saccharothrix deserti]
MSNVPHMSPLARLAMQFTALIQQNPQLVLDGWEVGGSLPDRMIPLDELSGLLLQRRVDWQTKDAAWAEIVRRVQSDDQFWTVGALGVGLPGLRRAARLVKDEVNGDAGDVEADVIIGFLEALRGADPAMRRLHTHLWRMAYQRGLATRSATERDSDWASPGRPVPLVSRRGHVDLVLLRAVDAGVLTGVDAEVVGRNRIERLHLTTVARDLGLSYADCRLRLHEAERRLADYLGHRGER